MRNKIINLTLGSVLACSAAAYSSVMAADLTGTLAATSEYMFRGLESSQGAAVQGSLDGALDNGLYGGIWGSNTTGGTTEINLYGGWSESFGKWTVDFGLLQFLFPENSERGLPTADYLEILGGFSIGNFSLMLYITDDFLNTDDSAKYLTVDYTFDIKETWSLTLQAGFTDGRGVETAFCTVPGGFGCDDNYTDYSVTLTKALPNDWGVSFALVNTNIDEDTFGLAFAASDDAPKFVVTLSKDFDI